MKVKDLLKRLAEVSEDAEVVIESSDHSYFVIRGVRETFAAVREDDRNYMDEAWPGPDGYEEPTVAVAVLG